MPGSSGLLIRSTNELGPAARRERYFTAGVVVGVNTLVHTCRVDVDATLPDGSKNFLEGVGYAAQTPPNVGDRVMLGYSNSSPHSYFVTGIQAGGSTSQGNITIVGGVQYIQKSGDTYQAKDGVILAPGSGVTITRSGNTFTFASVSSLVIGTSPISGGTAGRLLFEGTGNVLQESANLTWDNTNNKLTIITVSTATNMCALFRKTASTSTDAKAAIQCELQSSVALAAGAATGISFAIAGSSGTPLYVSAILGGYDTNATSGQIQFWTGMDTGSGTSYSQKMLLSREGNLSFSPATGGYGLRVATVTTSGITPAAGNTGALVYESGALKFSNGSTWVTLPTSTVTLPKGSIMLRAEDGKIVNASGTAATLSDFLHTDFATFYGPGVKFPNAGDNSLWYCIPLPRNIAATHNATIRLFWYRPGGPAQAVGFAPWDVFWQVSLRAVAGATSFPGTMDTANTQTSSPDDGSALLKTDIAISAHDGGFASGKMLFIRVRRNGGDASDTADSPAVDPVLQGLEIQYDQA